jgi:sec-independent protein translocase protein TatC
MGLAYAHNVLIPFLLQYLAEDSAASGLQSTWQLQSWVGFITGLYFSSVLGFQVPILAVLLLRSGLIERRAIVENRGAIWFAALFLGALISPPDPISLFLVGGPMLVLLEVALLYEGLRNRE